MGQSLIRIFIFLLSLNPIPFQLISNQKGVLHSLHLKPILQPLLARAQLVLYFLASKLLHNLVPELDFMGHLRHFLVQFCFNIHLEHPKLNVDSYLSNYISDYNVLWVMEDFICFLIYEFVL